MEGLTDETQSENDLSFDAWVRHVFDRPVSKPEWYFGDYMEPWADEKQMVLGYIARLFEAPEFLMQVYSRSQVGEGLWFLVSDTPPRTCGFSTTPAFPGRFVIARSRQSQFCLSVFLPSSAATR